MATVERLYDRGKRRGARLRLTLGQELRDARLSVGISQRDLGLRVRMPPSKISRIERGKLRSLCFDDAALLSAALGLDLAAKTYPGGTPIRDAGHAGRMAKLLRTTARPLRYRTEVRLPSRDEIPDPRFWDATISDATESMGVEVEMKLYDAQAQTRRIHRKWQDSGLPRMLLVIADTAGNRRVLRDFPEYFEAFPRLRTHTVLALLSRGKLPPSGMILF